MKRSVLTLVILFSSQIAVLSACVWSEHDRYRAADSKYRECLETHPGQPDRCEPLKAARTQAYEHYERTAEQAWGCEHTREGCEDAP